MAIELISSRQSQNLAKVPAAAVNSRIVIHGARTHNLKSVDAEILHDRLTVITGPSGCGKSSLAVDTLFAEGQRQYIETLSTYARQFVHQLPRADVDLIEGLEPTLLIDQFAAVTGKRSTVGTVTGIQDYLRLLFARLGVVHCYKCGNPIRQQSADRIVEWVCRLPENTRVMLLAPMVRNRKGKHADVLTRIRNERLVRCRIDGEIHDIESTPELDARKSHSIEALTDRIVVREGCESRLAESIGLSVSLSAGTVSIAWQSRNDGDAWQETLFSTKHACPDCEIGFPPIEPQAFSFNSPQGACANCDGLGTLEQFLPEMVFGNRDKAMDNGSISFWRVLPVRQREKLLAGIGPLLEYSGLTANKPLAEWSTKQSERFWIGNGEKVRGFSLVLEKLLATATSDTLLEKMESMRAETECPACLGTRMRPESLAVTVAAQNIGQVAAMTIADIGTWLESAEFPNDHPEISAPILSQLRSRVKYLMDVGLAYLSIDRPAKTLSGGEYQRVRLAAAIGNELINCCIVLDEPSIGLHPRDNDRLISTIRQLRDAGNTVVVVEHDEEVIRAADQIIDIGPGAGRHGGNVVASGTPQEICANPASVTGRFLSGSSRLDIPIRLRHPPDDDSKWISLRKCTGNNLRDVTVRFPTGLLTVVTGVSGSGKSTLVNDTLVPAMLHKIGLSAREPAPHSGLMGGENVQRVVPVDQKPLGRNVRGCPATFSGVMNGFRNLFSSTREAKRMGFGPAQFSFNSSAGWCPECSGHGQRKISMNFLPDMFVTCDTCNGSRYNPQSLLCRFRGVTIADILRMEISDAAREFSEIAKIHQVLKTLVDVGLGYLQLGQPTSTLSGGECQRLKLARELSIRDTQHTLYVLDEPTTGLHFEDVTRLLGVLGKLVEQGNTVIVIEHHLDVIRRADWVIDLGPEGGAAGGNLVVCGTPQDVASCEASYTGQWLSNFIEGEKGLKWKPKKHSG